MLRSAHHPTLKSSCFFVPFVVKNLFGHGLPNTKLRAAIEESGKIAMDDHVQGLEVHDFFKELDK